MTASWICYSTDRAVIMSARMPQIPDCGVVVVIAGQVAEDMLKNRG